MAQTFTKEQVQIMIDSYQEDLESLKSQVDYYRNLATMLQDTYAQSAKYIETLKSQIQELRNISSQALEESNEYKEKYLDLKFNNTIEKINTKIQNKK